MTSSPAPPPRWRRTARPSGCPSTRGRLPGTKVNGPSGAGPRAGTPTPAPVPASNSASTGTSTPPKLRQASAVRRPPPAVLRQALASRTAASRHGCPVPSTPPTNVRATPTYSASASIVTLSRTPVPRMMPPPPGPSRPERNPGAVRGRSARTCPTQPHASGETAPNPARPCPSVESQRLHRPQQPAGFVRHASVTTAIRRSTAAHADTPRDNAKRPA
jgi:hypothetical protein